MVARKEKHWNDRKASRGHRYRSGDGNGLGICPCGKYNYASRKEAKAKGKEIGQEYGRQRERGPISGYQCDVSGHYHWGHSSPRDEMAREDHRKTQAVLVAQVAAASRRTEDNDMTSVIEGLGKTTGVFTTSTPTAGAQAKNQLASALAARDQAAAAAAATDANSGGYEGEVTANVEFVTPAMAEEWLKHNEANRGLRRSATSGHERTIVGQNWKLNGETIKFTKSGRMVDGQHRLEGVLASGVGILTVVVRGLDEDAADTVDIGLKRNLSDVLTREGYTNASNLTAITTFALQVKYGRNHRATDIEKKKLIDNDPELRRVVDEILPTLPYRMASKTLFGYAYRILMDVDAEACGQFFQAMNDPGVLPEGSPIKALTRRLETIDRKSSSWTNRIFVMTLIVMAWNAWRQGRPLKVIKPYPKADGSFVIPKPV